MKSKKKNKLFLLIVLILGISVGYAFLSTTLNIMGTAGIKGNTWDIHWDSESVVVNPNSVSSDVPVVSGTNDDTVTFTSTLELPGDFYEFTVDAVNEGSVDGMIDDISTSITDNNGEDIELEDYIHLIITYDDGTPVAKKQLLGAHKSEKYKVRVEFDDEASLVPQSDITYNISYQVTYVPADDSAIPVRYATFGLGPDVNQKLKVIAGNTLDPEYPISTNDSNVTAIVRSNTAPDASLMTDDHVISLDTSKKPIYAWFDNGTIYYYSEAEHLKFSESTAYMFSGFTKLTSLDLSKINSSDVTNIYNTLANDSSLESANLSNFNFTSWGPGSLMYNFGLGSSIPIKTLILDKAQFPANMGNGFANLEHLETLSLKNVDTSRIANMGSMFYYDIKLKYLDLSDFDTSNLVNLNNVFASCEELETVNFDNWNTSNVNDMSNLFWGCSSLISVDLSMFNTSNVTNMNGMFTNNDSLEIINMSNFDLSKYHPENFFSCLGLSSSNVVKEVYMDNVVFTDSMNSFFERLSEVEKITLNNVNTSTVTNLNGVFRNCSKLSILDVSDFDTSNVTSLYDTFYGCRSLSKIDVSNFDTKKVTTFYGIFGNNPNLEEVNMSNFDFSSYDTKYLTSNIFSFSTTGGESKNVKKIILDNAKFNTSLGYAFEDLLSLEEISFKNVDTSMVTNMEILFARDSKIKELDLSDFDTRNVTNMTGMFENMNDLEKIYVGNNFSVSGVTNDGNMFYDDTKLVGGNGTVYNSNNVGKEYARIDTANTPGYFSRKS